MIGSDCCLGPDCCFRKRVQCIYLHVLSVLLHSWFGFRVFIAIRRFAACIQINTGQPGPLGHARHPMLSAIHHSDMRIACLRLHPRRRLPPAPHGLSGGVWVLLRTPAPPAPGAADGASSSAGSPARTCAIHRVFS